MVKYHAACLKKGNPTAGQSEEIAFMTSVIESTVIRR